VFEVVFLVSQPDLEGSHVCSHLGRARGGAVLVLEHAVLQGARHHDGACGGVGVEVGLAFCHPLRVRLHVLGTEEGEDLVETGVEATAVVLDLWWEGATVGFHGRGLVDLGTLDAVLTGELPQLPAAVVALKAELVGQPLDNGLGLHVLLELLSGE